MYIDVRHLGSWQQLLLKGEWGLKQGWKSMISFNYVCLTMFLTQYVLYLIVYSGKVSSQYSGQVQML